jgi:hypothetical protein
MMHQGKLTSKKIIESTAQPKTPPSHITCLQEHSYTAKTCPRTQLLKKEKTLRELRDQLKYTKAKLVRQKKKSSKLRITLKGKMKSSGLIS